MGMTIAVYRIDAKSGERTTVRDRYHVIPASAPPLRAVLPPCDCEQCTERERAGGFRDTTGTVQVR
jgi:hypothetical protein